MKITMLESVGAPNIDRAVELFLPILQAWRELNDDTKNRPILAAAAAGIDEGDG